MHVQLRVEERKNIYSLRNKFITVKLKHCILKKKRGKDFEN